MPYHRSSLPAWRPVALSLALLAAGLLIESAQSQASGAIQPPTAAGKPARSTASRQPPAATPTSAQHLLGYWHDDQVPEFLWVSRGTRDCVPVLAQDGRWQARPIMDVQLPSGRQISCNYIWQPAATAAPDTHALRDAVPNLERDVIVVNGMAGGADDAALWSEPWYELARARFQVPDEHPNQGSRKLVRVAVLDSAAPGGSPGYSDPIGHGRAVMRVIEELACGQLPSCAAEIVPYPALPLLSTDDRAIHLAPLDAGAVGSRGLLAAKIEQATQDWLQARASKAGPRRLVMNLSLGWSGCWEPPPGDENSPERLASQLVRDAIERAACQGAMVIAAGGNGDVIEGCPAAARYEPRHMFPGLWGGQAVTPQSCAAVGVKDPAPASSQLLLGIGAVDRQDARLSTSDHEADLVAYGQNVVVPDATSSSGYTLALAGTSMSAAAISGTVAALWAYANQLNPDEVVEVLRSSAKDLRAVPVEDHFICNDPAGCARVRRVGLCSALKLARPDLPCTAPDMAAPPSMTTPLAAAARKATFVDCSECPRSCPSECALPADAGERDAQDVPWIVPQPKPPACGTCALVPGWPVFQAQFTQPVRDLRLVVQSSSYGQLVYKLGDAETDPLEWWLPSDVMDAWSASLVYRPEGSVFHWESGDIPLLDWAPFSDTSGPTVL